LRERGCRREAERRRPPERHRLLDHLVGAGEQRWRVVRQSVLAVFRLITSSNRVWKHERILDAMRDRL
jgi:hypothetical protein